MVFDISDPHSPFFVGLLNSGGDVATEGLTFIYGADSADGKNYLVVTNETSGTTAFWDVAVPAPPAPALFALGLGGLAFLRRRRQG